MKSGQDDGFLFFFFSSLIFSPDNEPTAGMRGFSSFNRPARAHSSSSYPPNATLGVVKLWLHCGCLGPMWLRPLFLDYMSAYIARNGAG